MIRVSASGTFQSTPLSRGETVERTYRLEGEVISIHSPLTRGDFPRVFFPIKRDNFNPLPSHEGRPAVNAQDIAGHVFQSTPLSRGETARQVLYKGLALISIHSPLTRGDYGRATRAHGHAKFQSTPLSRGETDYAVSELFAARFQSTPLSRGETINAYNRP